MKAGKHSASHPTAKQSLNQISSEINALYHQYAVKVGLTDTTCFITKVSR